MKLTPWQQEIISIWEKHATFMTTETPALEIGNVVTLKSGGPKMTIASLIESPDTHGRNRVQCCCHWFDGAQEKEKWFAEESLELAK